jgi:hypothetical protein
MGQYFLQLQEQGKVPWEPIGDNDDVQDREECKVPWQIEQPVEGHSAVGHGDVPPGGCADFSIGGF